MISYFIFFLLLFLICRKYKSSVLNAVLLFYVAAAICGWYTHIFITPSAYYTFFSIFFHLLTLFLFLLPVIVYGRYEKKREIILMDYSRFKGFSFALIILEAFSVLYFLYYDITLFTSGDLGALRNAMIYEGESYTGGGILRTIAGVGAYYYCVSLLFFFYSLAFLKESKLFNLLLLLTSTSRIFHAFSYIGRDGILFWAFSFIFSYLVFKPYLSYESKKFVKKSSFLMGSMAMLLLVAISVSRFQTTDSGVVNGLIDYFGQPLNNFGQLFDKVDTYAGTKNIFPWLVGSTGYSGKEAVSETTDFFNQYGFNSNSFFTFIGSLYYAWGAIITFLVSLIFSYFFSNNLKGYKTNISKLLSFMFVVQIVWHNYFYFVYGTRVGNLFMFTLPILCLYCSKSKRNIKRII